MNTLCILIYLEGESGFSLSTLKYGTGLLDCILISYIQEKKNNTKLHLTMQENKFQMPLYSIE